MRISILICTRNRAGSLEQTLAAIGKVCVPEETVCELIVIDNGSSDATRAVVEALSLPNMPIRYVFEPTPGQCFARNTGIEAARGEIILFTDDDVFPPADWLEKMCRPILSGQCHAVAGGICIAPHLRRDWMQGFHRAWLASTEDLTPESFVCMIGANMAFSREALAQVPGFDTALGPGRLGFCDDVLFSMQLKRAGYTLCPVFDCRVEHHFDPDRLLRKSLLDRAVKEGRSSAYLEYHWHHHTIKGLPLRLLKHLLELRWLRAIRHRECRMEEGCQEWELRLVKDIERFRQFRRERGRPRNYSQYGLARRAQSPA